MKILLLLPLLLGFSVPATAHNIFNGGGHGCGGMGGDCNPQDVEEGEGVLHGGGEGVGAETEVLKGGGQKWSKV